MHFTQWPKTNAALQSVAALLFAGCALLDPKPQFKELLTDSEYSDFVLRFDFRLAPGTHGLIGLRSQFQSPADLNAAHFPGLVLSLNDDNATTAPHDRHGSLVGVAAAMPGALKPAGQWNTQEIRAQGRRITVSLNGRTVVDANLNALRDPAILRNHPEVFRPRGQIVFIARRGTLQLRNARIAQLPRARFPNEPATHGFQALFNGQDLIGWQGELRRLVDYTNNPGPTLASLTADQKATKQKEANRRMREHWSATDGELIANGRGDNLVTTSQFGNFELQLDWRTSRRGASGIFLRGQPQVQIWDPLEGPANAAVGSGGLYFGTNLPPVAPLRRADRAPGQWNRFRIILLGDRVHVFLNDQLVLRDAQLKNYWAPGQPIPSRGPIELQNYVDPKHRLRPEDLSGSKIQGNANRFRNIFIRELN